VRFCLLFCFSISCARVDGGQEEECANLQKNGVSAQGGNLDVQ